MQSIFVDIITSQTAQGNLTTIKHIMSDLYLGKFYKLRLEFLYELQFVMNKSPRIKWI